MPGRCAFTAVSFSVTSYSTWCAGATSSSSSGVRRLSASTKAPPCIWVLPPNTVCCWNPRLVRERRDVGASTTGTPPAPTPPSVLRVVDGVVGRRAQLPEQDRRQSGLPRLCRAGPREFWRQQRRRGVHL